MYMYYILGHKLMKLHELICVHRKAIIAQNTYLPALDGDIDLMPNAVHLVSDLMKRNANLATACGRIHPTGKDKQINNQIQIQIFQNHNQLELGSLTKNYHVQSMTYRSCIMILWNWPNHALIALKAWRHSWSITRKSCLINNVSMTLSIVLIKEHL